MAQRKLKVKSKGPKATKKAAKKPKGGAVTKRANRPVPAKKQEVSQKIKQAITKTVNKTAEDDIRSRATRSGKQNLSKAQQAVANHTKKGKAK
ncbi:unnamed protein product [Psylliodes chrysocephalus]|uniref:Uncharacterized protein n=1 Tax=Psylliodes chrysocephalus TaxID=3402493 RepID=A0A9P0CC91_9CUCU|nr:unnamed protein product [Psylliodes chrysocephala]